MSEPFIGQIILVPYNFAPRGYAFCAGQILPIAQNTALFSLLGTTYGGNGQTTFALPDLRGRVPVGTGQGPGLSNINLGEVAGAETATLTQSQMPAHGHLASVAQGAGTSTRPANKVPATGAAVYADSADGSTFNPAFVQNTGGSQPFGIRSPYLGLNYAIALEGIYPSRN
ncbi:MAG: phage tail protein [Acidimicrobiales bacterium]